MPATLVKPVSELFGLPAAPKAGRERLLAAAIDLFYRNGFNAVGIDQIIAGAGVTKTTFYKHFESKDDVMVAAVRRYDEWESQAYQRAVHKIAGDNPVKQFLATLDVMDDWFNNPEFFGCVFTNAAAEFPNPHDPVHRAAADFKKRTRDHWCNQAKAAGATAAGAETFADCFAALVEGAMILRKTQGRNDAARVIRPAVVQLMLAYFPAASAPSELPKPRPRSSSASFRGSPD